MAHLIIITESFKSGLTGPVLGMTDKVKGWHVAAGMLVASFTGGAWFF
jgi:hypothetical protein